MKQFTVEQHEDGVKLLKWVGTHLPYIKRGTLEKAIRKGWIKVDKKKPKTDQVLDGGQIVSLAEYLCDPELHPSLPSTETGTVNKNHQKRFRDMVIFENDELIAINKPAGLAVQGGSKQKVSVDSIAQSIATDAMRPRLVHRLDKDTSGVLVMAKTAKSATRLTKLFASKEIEKKYTALLVGVPKVPKGRIDLPMIKSLKDGHTNMEDVKVDLEEGKDAVTLYEVTHAAAQKYAWVDLYPITGRTHQLRVHMTAIHHPIVGDGKYGGTKAFQAGDNLAKKLHLHAASITIPVEAKDKEEERANRERSKRRMAGEKARDIGGETIVIEAPLPPHMQKSWDWLGSGDA